MNQQTESEYTTRDENGYIVPTTFYIIDVEPRDNGMPDYARERATNDYLAAIALASEDSGVPDFALPFYVAPIGSDSGNDSGDGASIVFDMFNSNGRSIYRVRVPSPSVALFMHHMTTAIAWTRCMEERIDHVFNSLTD